MKRCAAKPYEGQEKYIFVSYCHRDKAQVFPVIEQLAKDGYRVWYDEGIDPGSEWPEIIAKHLNGSAICIAFVTENALNSHNCRREINFALLKKKYFISVILEPVQMSLGMEMQLSSSQSIFKYTLSSDKEFFAKLCHPQEMEKCKGSPNYSIEVSKPEDYLNDTTDFDKVRDPFSDRWFAQGDNDIRKEEERRKAEEAARKAAEEEERRKAEEAARKAAEEEARRKAEEAARKAAEEEERRKAEEAARKAAEEERRRAEEAARKAAEEEERRKAEEAARKAAEEERRRAEEAARKAAEEEERRKAEEAARKAAEEERRRAEEAARKAAEEEERRKAEETARKAAEEEELRKAEEAARKAAEEEERRRAEEAARKAAEEEERRKAEEAARKAAEEEERRKAEEAARKAAEEEERRKAEEAARKAAEEEERRRAEEAARKAAEEEERRKAEEAARKAAEEEARRKAEDANKTITLSSIHILKVEKTGELINIIKTPFNIGRSENGNDYVISNNRSVSRSHATIRMHGDKCYVVDNNSLNKTYLNETALIPDKEYALTSGDTIKLYNEKIMYFKYHK